MKTKTSHFAHILLFLMLFFSFILTPDKTPAAEADLTEIESAEMNAYLKSQILNFNRSFSFIVSNYRQQDEPDMYAQFENLDSYSRTYKQLGAKILFEYTVSYEPGTVALRAIKTGDTTLLNANEKQVYDAAVLFLNTELDSGMSDYDTALAIHDYLTRTVNYVKSDSRDDFTAYGALVKRSAVCGGYARAYSLLMNAAGIETDYISGKLTSDENGFHSWNGSKILNPITNSMDYLYTDTTWDRLPTGNADTVVRHNYFMIPKALMLHSGRVWNDTSSYASPSPHGLYFLKNGLYADSVPQLEKIISREISSPTKDAIQIACAEEILNGSIDFDFVFEHYDKAFSYSIDPISNTLTLYL